MTASLISLDYEVPHCDTRLDQLPVVIGRAGDAKIKLDDYSVDNYHCRISKRDRELIVTDLGSVHGTFVNSIRVDEAVLQPGDELSVGMTSFLVQFGPGR